MEAKPVFYKTPFFTLEVPFEHLTEYGRKIVTNYQLAHQLNRRGLFVLPELHNAFNVENIGNHSDLKIQIDDPTDILHPDQLGQYSRHLKFIEKANFAVATADGKFLFIKATKENMAKFVRQSKEKNKPNPDPNTAQLREAIRKWF